MCLVKDFCAHCVESANGFDEQTLCMNIKQLFPANYYFK